MATSIGKEFLRLSELQYAEPSQQKMGVPQPPLELDYPLDAALIHLPDPADLTIPSIDLRQAIEQRVTLRNYSDQPLSLPELSYLLWLTQGVKEITSRPVTFRTVPSAGARHAFETYLLINRVDGVEPGLYRYIALEHALLPIPSVPNLVDVLTKGCLEQRQIRSSAVTFWWVACIARMYWRYGERGYRYLFLDAGHICQNLYLAAEAIGSGVCAIGAYDDEPVNTALGLDGETMVMLYAASVGKKPVKSS